MWKLFRGKKKNVLRDRVDTCDADTNQLLLGTFVFTISVFLFPTFVVYYVFFLLVRIAILVPQVLLFLLIVAIDACPAYTLVQYHIDPKRFPGGIHVGLETQRRKDQPPAARAAYMSLRSVVAPASSLLYPYVAAIACVRAPDLSARRCLCSPYSPRHPSLALAAMLATGQPCFGSIALE
jgi:hypothetical protein